MFVLGPHLRAGFAITGVTLAFCLSGCGGDEKSPDGGLGAGGDPGPWTMGAPFSTSLPSYPGVTHPQAPSATWGATPFPYPTNSFWMELVLGSGQNGVSLLPYVVKAQSAGLEVSLPTLSASPTQAIALYAHDVSLASVEPAEGHALTAHDLLSATLTWSAAAGTMVAPLVRGMPYATMRYAGLTPRLGTSHAVLSVNGAATTPVTGDRFSLALDDGRTWLVYASAPLTLAWTPSSLTAAAPFEGVVRVAEVGAATGGAAELDAHRGAYPVGGKVSATVEGDSATLGFSWQREGEGELLMMSLPHHQDILSGAATSPLTYATLRGPMTGVVGDTWTLVEPLPTMTWSAPRPIDPAVAAELKVALVKDSGSGPVAQDPYFFGKQIARLGRLALIADELGGGETAAGIRAKMAIALEPWLRGEGPDALRYDGTWGGICSTQGLATPSADFGQGYYNDHHFHYGYFLYAAAALGRGDAAWLAANREAIVALARDIANPSTEDPHFTPFRNMDWYEGHSWAAGLFENEAGRNQESSSEAVNAWYGLQLLGLASGDRDLENVGRVLLATEIRGAQRYWQVDSSDGVYSEPFASNKVVGIVWGSRADHATFFGTELELIHGIQLLPFTPVSEALLEPAWVTEQYPVASASLGSAGEGWRGLLFMEHAIIAPDAALAEIRGLTSYDDGNSATNALYWAATRPR
jgi:endo-1,3(4)-beta-glucanase